MNGQVVKVYKRLNDDVTVIETEDMREMRLLGIEQLLETLKEENESLKRQVAQLREDKLALFHRQDDMDYALGVVGIWDKVNELDAEVDELMELGEEAERSGVTI